MNNIQSRQPALGGHCEYLGLKDDSQTCLAFPSNWNYCYRARPPDSIRLEHQSRYCHSFDHVQCSVFQNQKADRLPPEVRGRRHDQKKFHIKRRGRIAASLFILVFALLILWLARSASPTVRINPDLSGTMTASVAPAALLPATPEKTGAPLPENLFIATPPTPGITSASTFVFISPNSPSNATASQVAAFTPSPAGLCGHSLDAPFGTRPRLVIHRAQNGESLNMYAINYQTSVDAIRAVNDQLPIPLRKDWVLVIPMGETQLDTTLPAFDPYLASEPNSSIGNLAGKFLADPQALKQYNDFDESCRAFFGWVLIPRQKAAP